MNDSLTHSITPHSSLTKPLGVHIDLFGKQSLLFLHHEILRRGVGVAGDDADCHRGGGRLLGFFAEGLASSRLLGAPGIIIVLFFFVL
jgi:hypothetical protein